MDIADLIQLLIAIIMGFTAFLSYFAFRQNSSANLLSVFNEVVKEEIRLRSMLFEYRRKISSAKEYLKVDLIKEADQLMFNYYDYVAILFFDKKVDKKNFLSYFKPVLGEVYSTFIESSIFFDFEDKVKTYPNLSKWFNFLGMSVRSKKDIDMMKIKGNEAFTF